MDCISIERISQRHSVLFQSFTHGRFWNACSFFYISNRESTFIERSTFFKYSCWCFNRKFNKVMMISVFACPLGTTTIGFKKKPLIKAAFFMSFKSLNSGFNQLYQVQCSQHCLKCLDITVVGFSLAFDWLLAFKSSPF